MQNSNTKLAFMEAEVKKRTGFSLPCKMQNEILKFKIFRYEKEIAKRYPQIYQEREGEDSPGGFGHKRTGGINK